MKRKRLIYGISAALLAAFVFAGCGGKKEETAEVSESTTEQVAEVTESPSAVSVSSVVTPTPTPTEEPEPTPPAGTYFSELTGEPVDQSLQNQRPVAVMVDNETHAYPHFGVAESDVVYEIMNSTENGRITRLMALVKDWGKISQMGSIRSTRPTNIILASEWNAVLCHDGGPGYVKEYFAKDYAKEHFSGTFSRVNNGKRREYTEYVLSGDLEKNFKRSGYSRTYNQFAPERSSHFLFVRYGTETDLNESGTAAAANTVALPFPHTKSTLKYNAETKTYDYYCYGKLHQDEEDGQTLTFKNVLIQDCGFSEYDSHGYMIYNCIQSNQPGYYVTNGHAEPITWTKESETGITKYYDADGKELSINRGKTYITMVPSDRWDAVVIQ